jgi:REP element-mobilizing transposase RayT
MLRLHREESKPSPFYLPEETNCVSNIAYSWSGRIKEPSSFPPSTHEIIEKCRPLWERDGFNLLTFKSKDNVLLTAFETSPRISPVEFCRKIKGRLSHQFRVNGVPVEFSRAVSFRSLGHNTTKIVNQYVKNQVMKEDLADEAYRKILKKHTQWDCQRDLTWASATHYGLYWYNIHLVIVAADRNIRIAKDETFETIKRTLPKIALKNGCEIAHFAIVPDHIHISLAANPKLAPFQIGMSFLNNLAYVLDVGECWRREFYVGTFSEYDLKALKGSRR